MGSLGLDAILDLSNRLTDGVAPAVRESVDGWWRFSTADLEPVREHLVRLYKTCSDLDTGATQDAVSSIAKILATNRAAILAVLLAPDELLEQVPGLGGQPPRDVFDYWLGMCWLAEAAWQAAGRIGDRGFPAGDAGLLYPLAARLRFLVLSEPMRHRGKPSSAWSPKAVAGIGEYGLYDRVYGYGSWNSLVGHCRQARRTWLSCLDTYQSHPYLASATPTQLEAELVTLAFVARRGRPLTVSKTPLSQPAAATAEDEAYIIDLVSQHLLPRFALGPVARIAGWAGKRDLARAGFWRVAVAVAVVVAASASVLSAAALHPRKAALLAAACYTLLGAGVVAFGLRWAAAWLLRWPAACAVGGFGLLTFVPDSWTTGQVPGWKYAVATLLTAAYGYLVVQACTHGVHWWSALCRALVVAGIGAVHATLVSTLTLVVVGPAVTNNLGRLWDHPHGYAHAGAVLATGTAWCLAVGVFTQILWNDPPITAPLAHTRWRASR